MLSENQFWEDLKSGKFSSMIKESSRGKTLTGSLEVYNILKPIFASEDDVEKMYFIFMDQKNRILAIENLSTGSIASSAVYPRELIKKIILIKANGIVMVHNLCYALHKLCYVKLGFMWIDLDLESMEGCRPGDYGRAEIVVALPYFT